MMEAHEFTWMVVVAIIVGFIYAFGIGANDVANAFGSSVSAKSLTLAQAIVVASTFEFLGAVLIGAGVTKTIRGGIIDTDLYEETPELIMFGMLSSLIVGSVWLLTATYFEFPVSTTHTIVGAIVGFSLAAKGFESIKWEEIYKLIGSWVASPVFSGIISFIFYYPIRKFVMEHDNSFQHAVTVFPIVVGLSLTVNIFFILFKANTLKALPAFSESETAYGHLVVLPASLGGGIFFALLTKFVIAPMLEKRVEFLHSGSEAQKDLKETAEKPADVEGEVADTDEPEKEVVKEEAAAAEEKPKGLWDRFADNTFRQDLHSKSMHENETAKEIWDNAIVYDSKTETLFSYLQVFTACLTSFAHGGNDVANAIAPLSAVMSIWKNGEFDSKSPVPRWILVMGGAGLSCGFIFFGYKIIKAVGFKITKITPSRGFCIELATSLAVASATFMNLPVSSTQCLVGATVGAGLASGGKDAVGWLFFARTCVGWASVFFMAVICTAGFFAYSIYSPNVL